MLTGQIGLIPDGKSFVPQAIQWITSSDVYHVVIAISETECIGAEPGGAKIRPIDYWSNVMWSNFPLTPQQAQDTADWARAKEGVAYNYVDDLLIGAECLMKVKFPEIIMRHYDNGKSYECAQLADAALTHGGGYKVFNDNRHPGQVYPGSFEPLFKQYGWWRKELTHV